MGMSIGFDEDPVRYGHGQGFFGGLGAGINAAMQGGGVQGFLDPIPFLQKKDQEAAKVDFNKVQDTLEPQFQAFQQAVLAGGNQEAAQALYGIKQTYMRAGYNPDEATKPLLQFQQGVELARQRGMDPGDPNYVKQLLSFAREPSEAANIYRSGVANENTQADTARTQQATNQEGQLFPFKLQEQQMMPRLREAQIGTENAQQGEIGARTGLLGSQTEQSNLENSFMRDKGVKMGTAGVGAGRTEPTVTVQTVDEQGNPIMRVIPKSEAIGQTFQKYEDPFNKTMRQSLQNQGTANQATPFAPSKPMAAHELSIQDIRKLPDEAVATIHLPPAEQMSDQQKQAIFAIRREAQAELARTPVAQRQRVLTKYNRRVLENLAGHNADNQ